VDKNVFLVRSALNLAGEVRIPPLRQHHDFAKLARQLLQQHRLDEGDSLLAVAPSARWGTKRWPPVFLARVLDQVAQEQPNTAIWLLGSDDERDVAEEVRSNCRKADPVSLAGRTNLGALCELLRASDALLAHDTGPMHLAAALRVPTVALFGPTSPDLTGPYGAEHRVFVGNCPGGPCFRRNCPRGERECVESIPTRKVAEALLERLNPEAATSAPAKEKAHD
jgi:lipopolysaccharide heptosyltransferase II